MTRVLITTLVRVAEQGAAHGSGSSAIVALAEMDGLRSARMPVAVTVPAAA